MKQKYLSQSLVSFNHLSNHSRRLFCFPHAGGSSSFYYPWVDYCNKKGIELIAIQLPGREKRIHELPLDNLEVIVRTLTEELVYFLDKPFIFFGHSMGAMVSYEICKSLILNNQQVPLHLFVSSCRAPHVYSNERKIYDLPKEEFVEKLRELNGTPQDILNNPDFQAFFIPVLRSDFKIAETYYRSLDLQLPLPITGLFGDADTVSVEAVSKWADCTDKGYAQHKFEGGHFYLKNSICEIIDIIEDEFKKVTYTNRL